MLINSIKMGICLVFVLVIVFSLSGCNVLELGKELLVQKEEALPSATVNIIAPPVLNFSSIEIPVLDLSPKEEPSDEDMVKIIDYIPSISVELKYATDDNFTGKVIYDFKEPLLRYGTVKKLIAVQEELAKQGYGLKIWDAYRPTYAQFALWEVCPNPTYVANPNTGYSNHSKGSAVDVTLVTTDGTEVIMPTGFDDFSSFANRDYSDLPKEIANLAQLLENIMYANGFESYFDEWWHYSDTTDYPVVEN